MNGTRVILRNYRLFTDECPLEIRLDSPFIALVGANNSGKSTFLRFFFELRQLWSGLIGNFHEIFLHNWRLGVNYQGILDPIEIFTNTNDRPVRVEIDLTSFQYQQTPLKPTLLRVIGYCDRTAPTNWRFDAYTSDDPSKPLKWPSSGTWAELNGRHVAIGPTGASTNIDCSAFATTLEMFRNAIYIGAFRNAINEGAGSYFDLAVGTSFIGTWHQWKTGPVKTQNRAIVRATKEIAKLLGHNTLEISASNESKTLNINADEYPYLLHEMGSGFAQLAVIIGNVAIKTPSIILVDEPELNLHPRLQVDFLTSLAKFGRDGIIFATHSVGLARSVANEIFSFHRTGRVVTVQPFEAVRNYAEFIGELSFSVFKEMGNERVLLVEGVNDVRTIRQFLKMMKKEHNTVLVPLGGGALIRAGVEHELSELTKLSENVYAIVDSERPTEEAEPDAQRRAFQTSCEKLGIRTCLTERRAIENYFPERAIRAVFGERYRSLTTYERLQDCSPGWPKSSNWLIAAEMVLDDIAPTDVGAFLQSV